MSDKNQRETIEDKLIKWESWDLIDTAVFQFMNVELIQPIGKFGIGEKFSTVVLNYEESYIELWKENAEAEAEVEVVGKYNISLTIGEEIVK